MLSHAAGRFVLKQSIRGRNEIEGQKVEAPPEPFQSVPTCKSQAALLHSVAASMKSSERRAYCLSEMCRPVIFFELLSWTDSFRLCSSAHVCWKGERPYCLLSAFKSPFSMSYWVQPLLLPSLLTCRKSFQHRHKSSPGEGFLSSGNVNKYVVVCSWKLDLTRNKPTDSTQFSPGRLWLESKCDRNCQLAQKVTYWWTFSKKTQNEIQHWRHHRPKQRAKSTNQRHLVFFQGTPLSSGLWICCILPGLQTVTALMGWLFEIQYFLSKSFRHSLKVTKKKNPQLGTPPSPLRTRYCQSEIWAPTILWCIIY